MFFFLSNLGTFKSEKEACNKLITYKTNKNLGPLKLLTIVILKICSRLLKIKKQSTSIRLPTPVLQADISTGILNDDSGAKSARRENVAWLHSEGRHENMYVGNSDHGQLFINVVVVERLYRHLLKKYDM